MIFDVSRLISLSFTDRSQINVIKLEVRTTRRNEFFSGCPKQYSKFLSDIDSWHFEDEPKYKEFHDILEGIGKQYNASESILDWEEDKSSRASLSLSDRAQVREGNGSMEPIINPQ